MLRQSALLLSLSLSLLISCTSNGSTGTGPIPGPSAPGTGSTPGPTPTQGGLTASPGSGSPTPGVTPGPGMTPGPGANGSNGSAGSNHVQRLEIRLPNRFLNNIGATVQLEVTAFDAKGNPVDPGPLGFSSSRPELISVDAAGLVRALVENGFAEIRVTAGGQTAVQLISVSTGTGGAGGGGGGGGGGGSSAPALEGVTGNIDFGFTESPRLTSLSAEAGQIGSQLTLSGSGFRSIAADDLVLIGGEEAPIIGTPTASSITVQVPAGALGAQNVTVTAGGQTSNVLGFRRILGERRVNTFTANPQTDADIAMDADGDAVITWSSSNQDGSSYGVYAQRYDSAGTPLGNEFRVNTITASMQSHPAIAMDADGDFVITWESGSQDGSGINIRAQRYTALGVPQGGEISVNSFTTGAQSSAAIAMDSDGDFVIAWHSLDQDGSTFGVYAQRYTAAGAPVGGEFRVNSYTTFEQSVPAIAMDSDGDFVIAWSSLGQDGSNDGIYAQRYNAAGAAQGGEFRVNTETLGIQLNPSLAMDADGDFVITWASVQDGDSNGIYAQRYTAAGVAQGNEFRVNTYTTGNQSHPSIAGDADGDFVIGWNSFSQDGDSSGVFAQRFTSAGVAQGSEFQVNAYTANRQQVTGLAMDASGNFAFAWNSRGQDGDGDGVYTQLYDSGGLAR